jgi:hypothetical protein
MTATREPFESWNPEAVPLKTPSAAEAVQPSAAPIAPQEPPRASGDRGEVGEKNLEASSEETGLKSLSGDTPELGDGDFEGTDEEAQWDAIWEEWTAEFWRILSGVWQEEFLDAFEGEEDDDWDPYDERDEEDDEFI